MKGYSKLWVLKNIGDHLEEFSKERITGRITPIIDVSNGTVSGFKIRRESTVRREK